MNNRIEKSPLRPKAPFEPGYNPKKVDFPHVIFKDTVMAKCPKCGRIIEIRTCYGCKELMCYDCLVEHQILCLKKEQEK